MSRGEAERIPGATVETRRHVPPCNDLCVECVMWRHIDKLRTSYQQKVDDLAKETLRTSGLIEALAEMTEERDYWQDRTNQYGDSE